MVDVEVLKLRVWSVRPCRDWYGEVAGLRRRILDVEDTIGEWYVRIGIRA
jgi:hypothetical protein